MSLADLPTTFTTQQYLAVGLTYFRVRGFIDRGDVVQVRRGIFQRCEDEVPETRSARHLTQARCALTSYDEVALSHLTAAAAYALPLPLAGVPTVDLTDLSGRRKSRRQGDLVIHTSDSYDIGVTDVDGVLVTSPARTVADCMREYGPRVSVPIADAALNCGLVTAEELMAGLSMQCHWPGRRRVDPACAIVDGRRESWLESYAAVRFDEWGIDQPTPQVEVRDEAGFFVARTDACWLEDATVLEVDGRGKYQIADDPRRAWELEKERFDRLGNLGLERVRFGLGDLLQRGPAVCRQIRARRKCGSRGRFAGEFRLLPSSNLTLC